jgi:hypothetical protein
MFATKQEKTNTFVLKTYFYRELEGEVYNICDEMVGV